jgi:hypothetical protein
MAVSLLHPVIASHRCFIRWRGDLPLGRPCIEHPLLPLPLSSFSSPILAGKWGRREGVIYTSPKSLFIWIAGGELTFRFLRRHDIVEFIRESQ